MPVLGDDSASDRGKRARRERIFSFQILWIMTHALWLVVSVSEWQPEVKLVHVLCWVGSWSYISLMLHHLHLHLRSFRIKYNELGFLSRWRVVFELSLSLMMLESTSVRDLHTLNKNVHGALSYMHQCWLEKWQLISDFWIVGLRPSLFYGHD